jgi:hypothetical protein
MATPPKLHVETTPDTLASVSTQWHPFESIIFGSFAFAASCAILALPIATVWMVSRRVEEHVLNEDGEAPIEDLKEALAELLGEDYKETLGNEFKVGLQECEDRLRVFFTDVNNFKVSLRRALERDYHGDLQAQNKSVEDVFQKI